eukprot:TRINITY_DN9125_c0_g1_i1.p1 TRINITY_DN9125_c0_g1~~TRINITY_DN9125_c0_g1_i1.p1  ORF type:complete len:278 (-),score=39.95 TRINITY_DN9125_c0_g1_i1:14-805(-)
MTEQFYDSLSDKYEFIFRDGFDATSKRQGELFAALIEQQLGRRERVRVLDAACGIGTQALGLAAQGFSVHACDLSSAAVRKAREKAEAAQLAIEFSVDDMRRLSTQSDNFFDVVIAIDNCVPHLLSEDEIEVAFAAMFAKLAADGICVVSVRDYVNENIHDGRIRAYRPTVAENGDKMMMFQVWTPVVFDEREISRAEHYETALYSVRHGASDAPRTTVETAVYFAIHLDRLIYLMEKVGFANVSCDTDAFYQPVVLGTKCSN